MWSTDAVAVKTVNGWRWMQNDHLGTPQQLLNPEGAVVHRQRMEAYGRSVRNGEEQSLRFAGQVEDAHSGTYYNFHRNYEARSGRYTQWDPIGIKGGVNVYGYVAGNPMGGVDPKGLLGFGKTCNASQRTSIINAIVALTQEIKEKIDLECKGQCNLDMANQAVNFLWGAVFSCNFTVPCAITTKPNYVYLYPSYIETTNTSVLTKSEKCGCFRGTLFHEALHHVLGWETSEDTVRRETRKCISCAANTTERGAPL